MLYICAFVHTGWDYLLDRFVHIQMVVAFCKAVNHQPFAVAIMFIWLYKSVVTKDAIEAWELGLIIDNGCSIHRVVYITSCIMNGFNYFIPPLELTDGDNLHNGHWSTVSDIIWCSDTEFKQATALSLWQWIWQCVSYVENIGNIWCEVCYLQVVGEGYIFMNVSWPLPAEDRRE